MTSPLACALLACALLHPAPFPVRTALDEHRIEDLPFDVTAPGTYVLTGDLGPSGAPYGIRILTDDVVIDLGGKVLEGGPGSGAGILAEGERRDEEEEAQVAQNQLLVRAAPPEQVAPRERHAARSPHYTRW